MKRTLWIRLAIVGAVTLFFFWQLVPPLHALRDGFQKSDMLYVLKPGIDLAGGSRLVYQVTSNWTGGPTETPAQTMIAALRERVDPNGVMNLIWRPLGRDKIEITIPYAKPQSAEQQEAYEAARAVLTADDISIEDIGDALRRPTPSARLDALLALVKGAPAREPLLRQLAADYDKQLEAAKIADESIRKDEEIRARMAYEATLNKLLDTNFRMVPVDQLLKMDAAARTKTRKDKQGKVLGPSPKEAVFKDYTPEQQKNIDALITAYDAWRRAKQTLDDPNDIKRLLAGTGVLEFHIAVASDEAGGAKAIEEYISELRKNPENPVVGGQRQFRWFRSDESFTGRNLVTADLHGQSYVLVWDIEGKKLDHSQPWKFKGAHVTTDEMGRPAVGFRFDEIGGAAFYRLTGGHKDKPLAAVLDGRVISIADIRSAIRTDGIISGRFSAEEAGELAQKLKAGALPGSLKGPISESRIGSLLGEAHAKAGLRACVAALIAVCAFMLFYYLVPLGLTAVIAVCFNLFLLMGAMALLPGATFTLPGIAGIVLTLGMAVDANVLISERIREEQDRGATLRQAIKNGYNRAFTTILDANVTTVITCIILGFIGTAEIRGFALTLGIGLVSSMFTSVWLTRWLMQLGIEYGWIKGRVRMMRLIHTPKIRWMQKRTWFWAVSAVLVAGGLIAFFGRDSRSLYDIEFTGGTKWQVTLRPGVELTDGQVQAGLNDFKRDILGDVSVKSLMVDDPSKGLTFEIYAPGATSEFQQVQSAILDALRNPRGRFANVADDRSLLKQRTEVTFDHAADWRALPAEVPESMPANIFAVTADSMVQAPNVPLRPWRNGVGLVLDNLNPAVSVEEVRALIAAKLAKLETISLVDKSVAAMPSGDFEVVGLGQPSTVEGEQVYSRILLLAKADSNDLQFIGESLSANANWWRGYVAPWARTAVESLQQIEPFDSVSNFDPAVAGDVKIRALFAILLSFLAISIYVWVRFGNWKFGLGAIIPLFHDAVVAAGFVAISWWLAQTAVGRKLLVENFRIDLTVVAALLTIIGYSINDTIVIFDRIRENRGRLGYVTEKIIDDSINQTMSRSILTSLTVFLVLLIMYVAGGPGIRAFNYTMLIGVIAGAYSTIAIASPTLLGWKRAIIRRVAMSEVKSAEQPIGTGPRSGE